MIVTAFVSGLSTVGALLVASYAILCTPYLSDVPIYKDGSLIRVQSKWTQLFAAVFAIPNFELAHFSFYSVGRI